MRKLVVIFTASGAILGSTAAVAAPILMSEASAVTVAQTAPSASPAIFYHM